MKKIRPTPVTASKTLRRWAYQPGRHRASQMTSRQVATTAPTRAGSAGPWPARGTCAGRVARGAHAIA